jgi:D-alanyl-D-alanine carboxypeptidase
MQLVEAGKLTLDSRLSDFITGLPEEWQSLTSRQLLGHASGLPDYMSQPAFDVTRDYEPAEILGLIKNLPLAFKPGTQVARSASDFFLLGLVIEKASGMTYEEFVTQGQIDWLGWHEPSLLAEQYNITDRAKVLAKMRAALDMAARQATSPY